jgi:hypothetical protein
MRQLPDWFLRSSLSSLSISVSTPATMEPFQAKLVAAAVGSTLTGMTSCFIFIETFLGQSFTVL